MACTPGKGTPTAAASSTRSSATTAAPISQIALSNLLSTVDNHITRVGQVADTARFLATHGELERGLGNVAYMIADTLEELSAHLERVWSEASQ